MKVYSFVAIKFLSCFIMKTEGDKSKGFLLNVHLENAIKAYQACSSGQQSITQSHISSDEFIEPFIVFNYKNLLNPIKIIQRIKLIRELKNKASHLLLSTQVEEYVKINLLFILIIPIYNLFLDDKILIKKSSSGKRFLSYNSYKISVNRLAISILKSIDKTILKDFAIKESTNQEETAQSINNAPEISSPNFYFTYPSEDLKLEKTILYDSGKLIFKIVPWFDSVYFEFDSNGKKDINLNDCTTIIHNSFPDLKIDINKVYKTGTTHKLELYPILLNFFRSKDKMNPNILNGSNFVFPYNPIKIMEYCDEKYDEAKHILNNPLYFKKLFYRFGTEIDNITYQAYEFWNKTKDIKKTWLMAEIWYAINYEYCNSVSDFIFKHTENWMSNKAELELIELTFNELKSE